MVEIRPYQKGDMFNLDIRHGDDYGQDSMVEPDDPHGFTAWLGDKPVACAGLMYVADGIAMFWSYFTDDCRGHAHRIFSFGRQWLKDELQRYHRIQATVRADQSEYIRFAQMFGFEPEGLMRKASPDKKDLWLFARIDE